jgi:beta-aspartyl-dipeptidase (metallo-type)
VDAPRLSILRNADLYAPEHRGRCSLLIVGDTIARVGAVEEGAAQSLGLPLDVIHLDGCILIPGLVDPHEHLIGAGGEEGYASRQPPVELRELVEAGVTTAVGCLGTDTTFSTLQTLLGKVRELNAKGVTAYMFTGGFVLPCPTITSRVMDDIALFPEILGVGEVALADVRSSEPTVPELARLVSDAIQGGIVGGDKAGVSHFHLGPGDSRLSLLHELLGSRHDIPAKHLYPTHVNRSEALMAEAIALAKRGAFVDVDTVDEGAERWLRRYLDGGGPPDKLTFSSDAHTPGGGPSKLFGAFTALARDGIPLSQLVPHFSTNAAQALRLEKKGRIEVGADADLVALDAGSLAIRHVWARGRRLLADEKLVDAAA